MKDLIITNTEVRMTSKELCELINMFRREEGNETEKRHDVLMRDIRTELEALANAGIEDAHNFVEVEYTDKKGEKRPCFLLTKQSAMQFLNKESAVVRHKTQEYISALEEQLKANSLPVPQQPQLIGVNPYHNRLIRKNINQLDAADIPRYVNNLLELTKSYTPSGRLNAYELTRGALENLLPTLLDVFDQSMVRASLDKLNKLIENQKMCINRAEKGAKTKKIINLEHQNHELEEELNQWKEYAEELKEYYNPTRIWTTVEYHGFTNNCMYDKGHRTPAYNWWIKNFPVNQVPTKKEYEMYQGIDFTKPIGIDLHFVNMEKYDTANLMKSALDMIFNRILEVDDNIIIKPVPQTVGYCDSTAEGKIIFAIYNIEEEPEMN